jgi:hypothetical protein
MEQYKGIPYGISNFKQLRREGLYFVDKSQYIQKLEKSGHFLFLIRPRRFGKSIFLNMLRAYYDVNESDSFDTLFDDLWIKEHPTPEKCGYQVIYFDFSRVGGKIDELSKNFNEYCGMMLESFADRYEAYYYEGFARDVKAKETARYKLNYIDEKAKEYGCKLYLIIDEYDNFTNGVLNEDGEKVYHALTHATGFYRETFKQYKGMFDRILMLGVSPVTMDDLTSGYNIATNITMRPEFNMMLGFSETDVREMIRYYQRMGKITREEDDIVAEMKPWYDNYCFAKECLDTDPKMFNCAMVLYFLNNLILSGHSPKQMIDPNTRTDYGKMKKLIRLDGTGSYRTSIINEIAEKGYTIGNIEESFPAEHLTQPEKFKSLLFYYGMLTISGRMGAVLKLGIPNNNVRRQYYDYLLEEYRNIHPLPIYELDIPYYEAAVNGNWQVMLNQMMKMYSENTSVRSLIEGERNVQGFMNALLNLNPYYLTAPEVELNHGYCDFFLMPDLMRYPMIEHSYILELKYLKTDASDGEARNQWAEAVDQIKHYAEGPKVRLMIQDTQLHLIVVQIRGYKLEKMEEIF